MADDDKKSIWAALPGILTGLAAVLTAVGALIDHSQSKPKPEPIRQESTAQGAGSKPSPEELAPPEGFQEQASCYGDCASPPGALVFDFATATGGWCRMRSRSGAKRSVPTENMEWSKPLASVAVTTIFWVLSM
jgi:hypothetical protein